MSDKSILKILSGENKGKFFTLSEVKNKYEELKSINKVAKIFKTHSRKIEKLFNENNIIYKKQSKHYDVNDNFFRQYNEQSFYIAGFIAADGNIVSNKPRLRIELANIDKKHLFKIKKTINFKGNIINRDRKLDTKSGGKFSYMQITSKQMIDDLNNIFNITPAKSLTYQFPTHLINNTNIKHFIRGIIDGDGTISINAKNKISISLAMGTIKCIQDIYNLIKRELNIVSGHFSINNNGKSPIGTMIFGSRDDVKKIIHWLYDDATIWLDRKYKIAKKCLLTNYKRKIININKIDIINNYFIYNSIGKMAKKFNCKPHNIYYKMKKYNLTYEKMDILKLFI